MPIIYNKLLDRMKEKGLTSYTIKKNNIIGQATLKKIKDGGDIDTRSIAKLCDALDCQPGDILEYVPDEQDENNDYRRFFRWLFIEMSKEILSAEKVLCMGVGKGQKHKKEPIENMMHCIIEQ